jgi:hypothetical protein
MPCYGRARKPGKFGALARNLEKGNLNLLLVVATFIDISILNFEVKASIIGNGHL